MIRQTFTDAFRRTVARDAFYSEDCKAAAALHGVSVMNVQNWRLRYFGTVQGAQWGLISRLLRDNGPMGVRLMRPLYEGITGEPISATVLSTRVGDEWRRGRLDRERVAGRWVYRIKPQ